jgi:glutathione S-transferase
MSQKVQINQALNMLDDDLEGKQWLCGDRFSAADVHFFGLTGGMAHVAEWVLSPSRKNVASYFERMQARDASKAAMTPTWAEGITVKSRD